MAPIVVDLGKAKAKDLDALAEGNGPLVAEVAQAFEQVKAGLPKEVQKDKRLVPVVVVYRKKSKKTGLGWLFSK